MSIAMYVPYDYVYMAVEKWYSFRSLCYRSNILLHLVLKQGVSIVATYYHTSTFHFIVVLAAVYFHASYLFILFILYIQALYPSNFLRNVAIRHSRGQFIHLTDIDIVPMPDLDKKVVKYLDLAFTRERKVSLFGSPALIITIS